MFMDTVTPDRLEVDADTIIVINRFASWIAAEVTGFFDKHTFAKCPFFWQQIVASLVGQA